MFKGVYITRSCYHDERKRKLRRFNQYKSNEDIVSQGHMGESDALPTKLSVLLYLDQCVRNSPPSMQTHASKCTLGISPRAEIALSLERYPFLVWGGKKVKPNKQSNPYGKYCKIFTDIPMVCTNYLNLISVLVKRQNENPVILSPKPPSNRPFNPKAV